MLYRRRRAQASVGWSMTSLLAVVALGVGLIAGMGFAPGAALAQRAGEAVRAEAPYRREATIHYPVVGRYGMVTSQQEIASRVGAEILEAGGNAVDAAVATGFALAVVLPRAGNIGGGGFMLVHLAAENRVVALDYRETAPAAATRDMFLDGAGNVDIARVRDSHLASGVPGTVAGLAYALEHYGTMSLKEVLAPAIRLADEGFRVSYPMQVILERSRRRIEANAAARAVFFKKDGSGYQMGDILRQADLAWTLRQIAKEGPEAFYRGAVAKKIVAEMERGGGLITADDLAAYRVIERDPVRGTYRGYEIVSMPPPSSGGVHVIQILNVLEHFDLRGMGQGSARSIHIMAEAMRQAYADRSEHLGDPDFYDVPVDWLTSKAYAAETAAAIPLGRARKSSEVSPGAAPVHESFETTHFSVMDAAGNAVSSTYTLNLSYGSGIMVAGAGFFLNDEMDDFSAKPGVPNAYGLIGKEANAVGPAKRPLSSMTPTIVLRDGRPWMLVGAPGGSRIITEVLQAIVNGIDYGMNAAEAIEAPRVHHQWQPDLIIVEPGISPDTVAVLRGMGHQVVEAGNTYLMGGLQAVVYEDGLFYGASDPRRPGGMPVAPQRIQSLPQALSRAAE